MPKKAVSVAITKKHLTKAERTTRRKVEESIKLEANQLKPAKGMTAAQRKIFRTLLGHLEKTGLLSNLDADTLSQAAITIDRMHEIDIRINEEPALVLDKDIMDIKDKVFRQYMKICAELYLSPAARANMGALAADNQKVEQDPLIRVLKRAEG